MRIVDQSLDGMSEMGGDACFYLVTFPAYGGSGFLKVHSHHDQQVLLVLLVFLLQFRGCAGIRIHVVIQNSVKGYKIACSVMLAAIHCAFTRSVMPTVFFSSGNVVNRARAHNHQQPVVCSLSIHLVIPFTIGSTVICRCPSVTFEIIEYLYNLCDISSSECYPLFASSTER